MFPREKDRAEKTMCFLTEMPPAAREMPHDSDKNSERKKLVKLSGGQTLNMTTGDPRGMILRFAVPVFLSQLFQQL